MTTDIQKRSRPRIIFSTTPQEPRFLFGRNSARTFIALLSLGTILIRSENAICQWSTSVVADSTLYVCPGFYPDIVTLGDGGSIILGALQSYIYAQKLDPYGYYLWTTPTEVFHNDSSFITSLATPFSHDWGGCVSDERGGVFLIWYDHREGYQDSSSGHWYNNAIYAQRVDSSGAIRWPSAGVRLAGPGSGSKDAAIVSDGSGGFLIAWTEAGFNYPSAPNTQYLKVAHYDQNAGQLWIRSVDSSFVESDSYHLYRLVRGGTRVYISYYANGNFSRVVDLEGNIVTPSKVNTYYTITSDADSIIFASYYPGEDHALKIGPAGDTIWSAEIQPPDTCASLGGIFVPDGLGGTYYTNFCRDTIVHVDSAGSVAREKFSGIDFGAQAFSDGAHGLVLTSPTIAKRFNRFGQMIWPSPTLYLQDPGNTDFLRYAPDNNGGVIATFWTTAGGIHAQHTGRHGRVGIITGVRDASPIPRVIFLSQNYPNPFNLETTISYQLSTPSLVTLRVFDLLGRIVANLVEEQEPEGSHRITFNAERLASGVYFYQLAVAKNATITKSMLLAR